jgi:hypothetical protein
VANNTGGISQTEAADRLGISRSWLYELTTKGFIRRNDDGSYPWPEIREDHQEYLEQVDGPSSNGDGRSDYERARARKTEAMAKLKELEIAERQRRLVPIDEVEERLRRPLKAVDVGLSSAPQRLAPEWSERLNVSSAEAISLITDLVEDVRAAVREELDELEAETGEPADSPLPEDFPARAWLEKAGVDTLGELRARDDLTEIPGIGDARARKIREVIESGQRS